MLTITPIPAFHDNYIWTLCNDDEFEGAAVVVDPGDAVPVEAFLAAHKLTLRAILITHHHADHTGGVAALTRNRNIPVYGPRTETIIGVTHPLAEDDRVDLGAYAIGSLRVMEVPGHTRGHVAYLGDGFVLCGDTLFAAGCGRLFEGTPAQMHASLAKLAALPAATRVYCTHEYTMSNLRFALAVEPHNKALQVRVFTEQERREHNMPTLPSSIELERATNPFLRTSCDEVIASAERFRGMRLHSEIEVFAAIRAWKDDFR
ncbi:MAG: hydroxyacylglutathione hydrolase [Casimicrobium sp.]